jgi:hypothetical protein
MQRRKFIEVLMLAAFIVVIAMPMTAGARVAAPASQKFHGILNDYTDTANAAGAWHITGSWSVTIKGDSGKADVTASIAMIRNGTGGSPHTHHIVLEDAEVTALPNGYSITGIGTTATNGTAAFAGSVVTVTLTAGVDVQPSNVSFLFEGPAAGHFGAAPIDGVVALD